MELVKRDELIKEKKFQQWKSNDHTSNRRFSDTKIKNKLEIEVTFWSVLDVNQDKDRVFEIVLVWSNWLQRNEEKSSNGISMLLIPSMRTPKVETGLGLGLTSSSMVNGRRKDIASCSFTSNSMPQPPPFLQQQALRKQRRCWTPELHRRFVDALQQLGGPGGKKTNDHPLGLVFGYLIQNVL